MFKNLKLGTKLILVGSIILLVPLSTVGIIAVYKATVGLTNIEQEQLAGVTKSMAEGIENTLKSEMKAVLDLSVSDSVIKAAAAVSASDRTSAQPQIATLMEQLVRAGNTEGLRDNSQVMFVAGREGIVFAASQDKFVGINVAD
ncbi:hypothetical protein EG833_04915, partial [archaeon]|nr:hypothetical protein [archaeon]